MNAPCKGCNERQPLCHMECEKYLEYRSFRDKLNEDKRAELRLKWDLNEKAQKALRLKLNRYKRDH